MKLEFRKLLASEVEVRTSKSKAEDQVCLLLYKDARIDQGILDEIVGPMNWQKRYNNGNTNCVVSIWDTDKKQWVEKEDVGNGTGPDARKATASDAFKRACFNWGIGRELYTAPKMSIPKNLLTNIREDKDGIFCDNKFRVKELSYTEDKISNIVIEVLLEGVVVQTLEFSNNTTTDLSAKEDKQVNSTPTAKPAATKPAPKNAVANKLTEADLAVMYAKAELAETTKAGVLEWVKKQYQITDITTLTEEQYKTVCRKLDEQAAKKKK